MLLVSYQAINGYWLIDWLIDCLEAENRRGRPHRELLDVITEWGQAAMDRKHWKILVKMASDTYGRRAHGAWWWWWWWWWLLIRVRGGLVVSMLDSVFKSLSEQKFCFRFLLHLCPLTNAAIMSTPTVHHQWGESTRSSPSYAEAKKMKSLAFHTNGCLRANLRDLLPYVRLFYVMVGM